MYCLKSIYYLNMENWVRIFFVNKHYVDFFLFLEFNLDFYADVMDLSRLTDRLDDENTSTAFKTRHKRLNQALCEVIDDHSLVGFQLLNITDKESVLSLLSQCDKSIGFFAVGKHAGANPTTAGYDAYSMAVAGPDFAYERSLGVQERVFAEQEARDEAEEQEAKQQQQPKSASN